MTKSRRAKIGLAPMHVVPAEESEDGATSRMTPTTCLPRPRSHPYPRLAMAAKNRRDMLDLRKRVLNRIRCFVRDFDATRAEDAEDLSDEELLAISTPQERAIIDGFAPAEHAAEKDLLAEFKAHPLYAWAKGQRGVGAGVLMALLIGDLEPFSRFATVSAMWQYCGHGDPVRSRRTKGAKTEYNPDLKVTCYLIGKSIVKSGAGGDLRAMYDDRKVIYAARPWCGGCNPKGVTTTREHCTPGHAEAKARRYVVKQLLAELWVQGRRAIKELEPNNAMPASPKPIRSRRRPMHYLKTTEGLAASASDAA